MVLVHLEERPQVAGEHLAVHGGRAAPAAEVKRHDGGGGVAVEDALPKRGVPRASEVAEARRHRALDVVQVRGGVRVTPAVALMSRVRFACGLVDCVIAIVAAVRLDGLTLRARV